VVGDFNGDGRLDVVTAQQLTDTVSVLLGHGNGTFAPPLVFAASGVDFTPQAMAVGDINGDGKLDLVIKSVSVLESDASQLGVLLGTGDGTFRGPILAAPHPGESGDLALGDFNNDGRPDVAVAENELGPHRASWPCSPAMGTVRTDTPPSAAQGPCSVTSPTSAAEPDTTPGPPARRGTAASIGRTVRYRSSGTRAASSISSKPTPL
jgi:hypothetical protein